MKAIVNIEVKYVKRIYIIFRDGHFISVCDKCRKAAEHAMGTIVPKVRPRECDECGAEVINV